MPENLTYEVLKKRVAQLEQKIEQFKSEAVKYRTLFNSFPHGITVSDADGNIVETNIAAKRLLGVDKSEHERRKVDGPEWRIIRPDGSDMPPEEWASVVALKEKRLVSNCEMGIVKASEKTTWINVTATPIEPENNRVVVTYNDISEKKQAEAELSEMKRRFHQFFESNGFYAYIIAPDSTIVEMNEAALSILGYTKEELLGKPLSVIYAEESLKKANSLFEMFKKTGKVRNEEMIIQTKSGNRRWVILNVDSIKDDNGDILYSSSIQMDITALKEYEKTSHEREQFLEAIYNGISHSIFVVDVSESGEFKYAGLNPRHEGLTGISNETIIGKTPEDVLPEEAAINVRKKYTECINLKQVISYEEWLPFKGKQTCWETTLTPQMEADGRVNHIIGTSQEITSRKVSELALQKSEKRHRTILKTMMDGYWLTSIEGILTEVNEAYCKMSGYREREMLGMHISELDALEDRQLVKEHMNRVINRGTDRFESRHRRKDGTIFDVEVSTQYSFEEDGRCVCFIRDITERKNYENALLNKTAELEQILQAIPDALVYADTDRRIIRVNDSFVETFGYKPDEVLGKKTEILYASREDFLQQGKERYNKNLGPSLEPYYLEYRRKNGEVFPTESVGTTVRDTANRVTGLLGLVRDISHTKYAEQTLLETKQKYQSMVENIGIGVSLINKEFQVVEMNRQMRKWRPNIDTSTAPLCYEAFNDPPFNSPCSWCPTSKTLRDGKVHESITDTPEAGGIRNYRIVSSPIINTKGEVVAAIEMVEDMTERLEFEKQIQQAQRMESIGNLAGGIAHDFNNILFPIVGMAELLLEDLPSGSPERENTEEILRAGMRGSDLVKQILAFSRQSEHQMVPTRIQNILREVLKLSRATIPAYIEIQQDIQNDCGMVRADATQIHQVAMNIITNAFHAMENRGGKLTVRLCETEIKAMDERYGNLSPGIYAHISISDTGHGMPPDLIKKIFDPYFTTKEQGKGTGLGLAVVHGIVKEHNGDIKVVSEIGEGSIFNVYLPLMEKPDQLHISKITKKLEKGHERILLVDDEEPIAKLEKQILERLGYKVTILFNGLEALELFKAKPQAFDLIISDMSMPNISGDELSAKMKSIRSDIPVILCTGFSERIKDRSIDELGINGMLMKPVSKTDLAQCIRKALDQPR